MSRKRNLTLAKLHEQARAVARRNAEWDRKAKSYRAMADSIGRSTFPYPEGYVSARAAAWREDAEFYESLKEHK